MIPKNVGVFARKYSKIFLKTEPGVFLKNFPRCVFHLKRCAVAHNLAQRIVNFLLQCLVTHSCFYGLFSLYSDDKKNVDQEKKQLNKP